MQLETTAKFGLRQLLSKEKALSFLVKLPIFQGAFFFSLITHNLGFSNFVFEKHKNPCLNLLV